MERGVRILDFGSLILEGRGDACVARCVSRGEARLARRPKLSRQSRYGSTVNR